VYKALNIIIFSSTTEASISSKFHAFHFISNDAPSICKMKGEGELMDSKLTRCMSNLLIKRKYFCLPNIYIFFFGGGGGGGSLNLNLPCYSLHMHAVEGISSGGVQIASFSPGSFK
jgi:hypothetical protein